MWRFKSLGVGFLNTLPIKNIMGNKTIIIKNCIYCDSEFETIKNNDPKRDRKCCSRSCASKFAQTHITDKSKKSRVDNLKKFNKEKRANISILNKPKKPRKPRKDLDWVFDDNNDRIYKLTGRGTKQYFRYKLCGMCGDRFKTHTNKKKFCSPKCAGLSNRHQDIEEYKTYKARCAFEFNLSDYSDKFDFTLIEKFGWYSPTNRKNNPNGVSRDHRISVKYGYDNGISPNIIKHPANCELLPHSVNNTKKAKNSITIEDLLISIYEWDNVTK